MDNFWKWLERIAWITAVVSFLKWWDMQDIVIFVKQFWNSFTPWQFLFFLSIIILLYRLFRFLVNVHKSTKGIRNVGKEIDELKGWIGRFEYQDDKGGYLSLKGKIKRYVQEELEKECEERKADDARITETFTEKVADIEHKLKYIPRPNQAITSETLKEIGHETGPGRRQLKDLEKK